MDANATAIHPALANYWWYEHLLCLPDVDTEIVTHFGERLRELPTGNMPASLAVRLFLRQIRLHSMREEELLSVMGLFQLHSEKQQQFQSIAVAQAIQPPDALLTKVLQQCLVSYCLQSFQQGQSLHDITAAVEQQTLHILQKVQLEKLLESEQLKQSLVTLRYVLGRLPQPTTLDAVQQLLYRTFPKHLMEDHLQHFAKSAWEALGASSLEVFQRATLSGQLPFHPFLNFLQENEELQREIEEQAQQQQEEQAGAVNPAVAATPGELLIVGGQQQELVIPDSTDPAAANRLTQPSSTPGIPSPRSGSDPAPAAAGGKQQRRVGDPAAAAVRGQLNLLPSTAAARNAGNQQQQYTAAVGEENTPPEEHAAVLQALIKSQAQAAAAAKQQQPGRELIQRSQPPAAAAAVPVLTWEQQVMGHSGAGIAWGGDRRKLKNDKIRAEKQQTAEERARKKAEREEREAQQKVARKLLREQEKARREEERKAAEAAKKAEAKAARAKQRQEEEQRKEVERELARLQREEAKAAKLAEKEDQKKERAAARKAARAAGKKANSESEEEMEIPEEEEEDEEEFVSIAEDSSSEDFSEDLSSESDGWSTESTSVQELDSDEAGDRSSRPAAAAAAGARKAGSKIKKPLPQAKIMREQVSGADSDQQGSGGHGRVAPGRGRKPSKQAAAAAEDSEDLFADLEVNSDADSDQPVAGAAGSRKRKPDRASEEPVAAAATAGPSKKREKAAAAAHGGEGRPARPDLEQDGVQPAAAAAAAEPARKQQKSSKAGSSAAAAAAADGADNPAKQGLCGRGGPKTGAGRTVQWDSSQSEAADELAKSPSACQGPQTAAEMRAHLAKHREKNGGLGVAAAMLELLAQKQRDKGPGGDTSDDEEEADEEARAGGHRRGASNRQAAAAAAGEGEEAVDGSGGDIYEYVMNESDEERQRRKRKKKQKKAAAAAAAAAAATAGDAAAGGAAAAREPVAGAAPAGAGPKASSSSTPAGAAEAEGRTGGRRKVVRWSRQEEELLERLVGKYGVGKWAAIKEEGAGTFLPHRTAVDLKDKWRNILKSRGLL